MISTKQLSHLKAVLDYGTIHAASQALHITQPALTRSLANLESQLGTPLFLRSKSGMTPTEFCLQIRHRAETVLSTLSDLKREAEIQQSVATGELRLAFGQAIKSSVLRRTLSKMLLEAPDVSLTISEGTPEELHRRLVNRQVDMLFMGAESIQDTTGIRQELITSLPLRAFARPDHPLSGEKDISVEQLSRYPLVAPQVLSSGHRLRSMLRARENALGLTPGVICSDYEATRKLLLETDAWAIAPEIQYQTELSENVLLSLDIPSLNYAIQLAVVEPKDQPRTAASERFLRICRSHFCPPDNA
ncbi:hypothetical protein A3754_09035 [Alcanivorax sp. HI0083]|nr:MULTISPECIES: LysR family transcriptional regulator [unclassified Alcanivorax]KZY37078.1 hypothetical protein A3730_12020 [Alcanivorax sp. HI0044]KZZ27027.1 hypothetical protein A3754_09035 [Alcanivorax sp. HI0083]